MIKPGTNFTGADAAATSAPAMPIRIHQCRSSNSLGKSMVMPPQSFPVHAYHVFCRNCNSRKWCSQSIVDIIFAPHLDYSSKVDLSKLSELKSLGGRMRKIVTLGFALLFAGASPAFAKGGGHTGGHISHSYHATTGHTGSTGVHTVRSYNRRNGTHVDSYHATNRNRTKNDNFTTRGNVNPYTGKAGTKPRDGE
jgi:hypothetical protein